MMGKKEETQGKLFYTNICIEKRVPDNHILRKVKELIDFDFVYDEVEDKYGYNGNVSVPPPVILKLIFILISNNVRSERELMAILPSRLDWLWFLGYDLDDEVPDHSVLSKARKRWGVGPFKGFFMRVVLQCVEAGLISGDKIFLDSSLVDANASNNSVVDVKSLKRYLNKSYRELESRLEDTEPDNAVVKKSGESNRRYISTTDPDASVVRRGKGKSKLQYQIHRAVDVGYEVITATEVTPGEVNEAHRMKYLMDSHHVNTGRSAEVVVADSKYGTVENYLACYDWGVRAHFSSLEETQRGKGRQEGIFPKEMFTYNDKDDTFTCPAGQVLKKRSYKKKRQHYEYAALAEACNGCHLKEECTRSKTGRTLKRHVRQEELDLVLEQAKGRRAREDIKTRQHLMERSFARASRYGFDQARWRGNDKVSIQEYLTSTIQNIMIIIRHGKKPSPVLGMIQGKTGNEPRITGYREQYRLYREETWEEKPLFPFIVYFSNIFGKIFGKFRLTPY